MPGHIPREGVLGQEPHVGAREEREHTTRKSASRAQNEPVNTRDGMVALRWDTISAVRVWVKLLSYALRSCKRIPKTANKHTLGRTITCARIH